MYDHAFPNDADQALEAMLEQKPKPWSDNVTEDAQRWIANCTISAIVRAFARRMALRGIELEKVKEDVSRFIDTAIQNGDLKESERRWLLESDNWAWGDNTTDRVRDSRVSYDSARQCDSLWSLMSYIIYDASWCRGCCSTYNKELFEKCSSTEKALITNVEEARRRLYEAEEARDNYFNNLTKHTVKDLITKYADVLTHLDEELYSYLDERVSDILGEPTNGGSSSDGAVPAPPPETPSGLV